MHIFVLLMMTLTSCNIYANISPLWEEMQKNYRSIISDTHRDQRTLHYCHPHWASCREALKTFLLGNPKETFIDFNLPGLGWTYSLAMEHLSEIQTIFLQNCVANKTKILLENASDHPLAKLPVNIQEFNCSVHCLNHLFYLGRILETRGNNPIKTTIEIGSGYGNLMRLLKQIAPESTNIMFDIPEMAALQWLYLKSTLPQHTRIFLHASIPNNFEPGAIHILPISFIDDIELTTDIFISTFALSESANSLQKKVIEKRFFNANVCYLAGQLEGWSGYFVGHNLIHEAIRNQFAFVVCSPFPNSTKKSRSYEIIAKRS